MQRPPDRRSQILSAALGAFLERGYVATSIADIRQRSGASTGSIYHFFANKGALAEALLHEAVAGWSVASGLSSEPGIAAELAIKASVAGLVTWGIARPAELRFVDEMRTLAAGGDELAGVRAMLAAGQASAEQQYARFLSRGEVRALPWPLAHSLMLGPAYNYLRLSAAGADAVPDAATLLADAAWASVRSP